MSRENPDNTEVRDWLVTYATNENCRGCQGDYKGRCRYIRGFRMWGMTEKQVYDSLAKGEMTFTCWWGHSKTRERVTVDIDVSPDPLS